MTDTVSEAAFIGAIRCRCGGRMDVLEEIATETVAESILYTVECLACGEKGGYNSGTLEVFGAVDRLDVVGK